MSKTKALVTGAAGFIGSYVCAALRGKDCEVCAADLPGADWWRHDRLDIECQRSVVDVTDAVSCKKLVDSCMCDVVFHLAAAVDVQRDTTLIDTMLNINVCGALNMLNACRDTDIRIVLTGTCEEYGDGSTPFVETQRERAVSPYSWSKVCQTHLGQLYWRVFNTRVVVVRPFLTYGPLHTTPMLINTAIDAALKGENFPMTLGEQTREFNYVTDIADGFVRAGLTEGVDGEIFSLGNGREYQVAEVVRMIYSLCKSTGKPEIGALQYRGGETMHFFCDSSKAREELGWVSRVSLEDGLLRTIEAAWKCDV